MNISAPTVFSFVSIIIALISCIMTVVNSRRNRRNDDKDDATERTTVIVKLENINNGVNEIKSDVRELSSETRELRDRLILVEESSKSAHHRIDTIEGRGLNEH